MASTAPARCGGDGCGSLSTAADAPTVAIALDPDGGSRRAAAAAVASQ